MASSVSQSQTENQCLLSSETKVLKPFPPAIIKSIETNRRQQYLSTSYSSSDFLATQKSLINKIDTDLEEDKQTILNNINRSCHSSRLSTHREPSSSELRLTLYSDDDKNLQDNLLNAKSTTSKLTYKNKLYNSHLSFSDTKYSKQSRADSLRRVLSRNCLTHRLHDSSSPSIITLRLDQRRSLPSFSSRHRRKPHLSPNSKWYIVHQRLNDIAMMNESYSRLKLFERDIRWIDLRQRVHAQLLDMREMSQLRLQDNGVRLKHKRHKTKFDIKAIPPDEVVHIERDGEVHSIGTRDLVLGRVLFDEAVRLDAFAQLDARRQFRIQQHLVQEKEGKTRLKKHIAFSLCLCNLSFIALMFAIMLIFAVKTIFALKLRESH